MRFLVNFEILVMLIIICVFFFRGYRGEKCKLVSYIIVIFGFNCMGWKYFLKQKLQIFLVLFKKFQEVQFGRRMGFYFFYVFEIKERKFWVIQCLQVQKLFEVLYVDLGFVIFEIFFEFFF